MTAKLPILKSKKLIKALQRAGFYIYVHTGGHAQLRHPTKTKLRVTVPIHSKDIGPTLLKHILAQAHLTADQFRELI